MLCKQIENKTERLSVRNMPTNYKEKYTEKDMLKISEDLILIEEKLKCKINRKAIGEGGFSLVFLGTQGTRQFAVKMNYIKGDYSEEKKFKWSNWAKNEKLISLNLKNKNCIKCYNFIETQNSTALFLEFASRGDLASLVGSFYGQRIMCINDNLLSTPKGKINWCYFMSESMIIFFIQQAVNALKYLNEMNLVHRDIKLENFLVTGNLQLKLSDFALSNSVPFLGDYKISFSGTQLYMSPEIVSKSINTVNSLEAFKFDYYALGMILYKMLFGQHLISLNDAKQVPYEELKKILLELKNEGVDYFKNIHSNKLFKEKGKKICREDLTVEAVNFLKSLIEIDYKKRTDIKTMLSHSWLSKNKNKIEHQYVINQNDPNKLLIELQKNDYILHYNKKNESKEISRNLTSYLKINHMNITKKVNSEIMNSHKATSFALKRKKHFCRK